MSDSDSDGDSSRDLYDSDMGDDVKGGQVTMGDDGSSHSTVYGEDRHFSWDSDKDGNVSGVHGTEHGGRSGNDRW